MSAPRASGPWVSWTFAPRCGVLDENGSSGPEAKAVAHLRDLDNLGNFFGRPGRDAMSSIYVCVSVVCAFIKM